MQILAIIHYIHGNVGMGKTHLLNIAIELRKSSPDLQIVLMSLSVLCIVY